MSSARIFFAGDFCSKPSTSLIAVSDELRGIVQSADIAIVGFEVPLKPEISLPPQKYERFWQNDDAPGFLFSLGFNLFSLANNHSFDWGEAGFRKTRSALGDHTFGAGTYEEAYQVKTCVINGLRIGFLGLTFAAYTGVFDDPFDHDGLACAWIDDLKVNHVIADAKKEVDYLFIFPHDGIEYIDIPIPEIIARYRDFIDWGADGVIGSHPHCPQGWEDYKGKPIFYSLGNFFFNSKEDTLYRAWNRPHWYEGLCVEIDICDNEMRYHTVNTRNIDNVQLVVDKDPAREQHNQDLLSLLKDKKEYAKYLMEKCRHLSFSQEMPIIDGTFHVETLKTNTKKLLKSWISVFRGKDISNDFSLRTLLKNRTRRSVLLRALR